MAKIEIPTTISGEIVTAEDATTRNAIALSVSIDPVQDLHGYDNPWPAGGGANVMPQFVVGTYTADGITAVIDANGKITVTGEKTTSSSVNLNIPLSITPYAIQNGYYLHLRNSQRQPSIALDIAGASLTLSEANRIWQNTSERTPGSNCKLYFAGSVTGVLNFTLQPSVEATGDVTSWTPYSNICPISGHTSATVTRTGKNLFNLSLVSGSNSALSWTVDNDGSVKVTMNAWVGTANVIDIGTFKVRAGVRYKLSGCPSGGSTSTYRLYFRNSSGSEYDIGNGAEIVRDEDTELRLALGIGSGTSPSSYPEMTFYPMIQIAEFANTAYEPYQGTSVTIDLDGTRYGGTLDILTGELTVTWVSITLDENTKYTGFTKSTEYGSWADVDGIRTKNSSTTISVISDRLSGVSYEDRVVNPLTDRTYGHSARVTVRVSASRTDIDTAQKLKNYFVGGQLVYLLETPQTVTLTPSQLAMLEGTNILWSDTGNIEKLTYYRSVEMALNTMYPAKNGSPKTTLAQDITAAATSMVLADVSVLPPAPNLAVLGEEETAEIVLYNEISGNVVSGMIRGINGTTASVWTSGTSVARNFTSYDHDTIIENFLILDNEKAPLASPALTGTPTAPTASAGNNSTQIATTAFLQGEMSTALAKEVMYFTNQTVSVASSAQIMRIPSSGTNDNITTNTVVLECTFADPANIVSDVSWTSHAGYITFSGTCTSATTANVTLGTKGN